MPIEFGEFGKGKGCGSEAAKSSSTSTSFAENKKYMQYVIMV